MNTKTWLSVLAVSLALAGCAPYQRQQAALQYQQNMASARDNMKRVCDEAYNRPEMDVVRAQVPADPSKASVEQLSDKRLPTKAQREVVAHFENVAAVCIQATKNYVHDYAPYAAQALDEDHQKTKLLLANMYGGHMTFGEFNQERAKIHSDFVKEAYAAQNQYRAQQQQLAIQQQQLNIQREQAAIAAQQAYHPYVAKPYVMPTITPTTTNCYRTGYSVTCHSY